MFPWRTINGDEASAYYAAGTAAYHINADIMYALRKYVNATGDEQFLQDYGAEMLVETARLWLDLGFYSDRNGEKFCINGVTGPWTCSHDTGPYMGRNSSPSSESMSRTLKDLEQQALTVFWGMIRLSN